MIASVHSGIWPLQVFLVVKCSFCELYCAHLACNHKFLEQHEYKKGNRVKEGLGSACSLSRVK